MSGEVRVGTSGWQYADWRGTVYPQGLAQKRWLSHYVGLFPTVEVNATFYRLARESAARGWAGTAPPGFEFVLKGSQFITHRLKLNRPEPAIARFFEPLEPVLPRTSVILWQLPPNWKRNVERLDAFLSALPPQHRYAVEFRDDDWFHPDTYEVLERHGAANVWLSSVFTTRHDLTMTGGFVYLRLHGLAEDAYRYDYSREELTVWADRLREQTADGTPAWVFFNNDYEGHAVRNGHALMELLEDRARPAVALPDPSV